MRNSPPPPPLPDHAQRGSVASTVRALAAGTLPSDVWRGAAFALLRLNPSECEALGRAFEDPALDDERRMLVLDLLAGAGSFEAQVVIRRLLALALARRDSRTFAGFVQRLAIVDAPDGPTLRFLMSIYAESRGEAPDVRAACAHALGAAAGQALASGDEDSAARSSEVLRCELEAVTAPAQKAALLGALGNAGLARDVPLVARFVGDADAQVRAAAALALRKTDVPEARALLVALLADGDSKVAHRALAALSEHRLVDAELELLAEQVLAGRTPLSLDLRILKLIVAQRPRLTSVPGQATAIENALRLLLGRVEAAAICEPTLTGAPGAILAEASAARFPLITAPPPVAPTPHGTPIPAPPMPMSALPPQNPYVHDVPPVAPQAFDLTVDAPMSALPVPTQRPRIAINPNAVVRNR